jgi:hypothetical protein
MGVSQGKATPGDRQEKSHDQVRMSNDSVTTGHTGDHGMPFSFQRGRWLRTALAGAAICLSAISVAAAEDLDLTEAVAQLNSRTSARESATKESEQDERAQYPGLTVLKPGTSTSAVRKLSIADLKLERLSPDAQQKSQLVLKNLGMFRRLPTVSFECDPAVYDYFVRNPDVAVATWRAMDISQFQLQQTTEHKYHADAGDGSVGDVELLLQTPTDTIIHCDGAFKSPLLPKPIVARSLMRLQTSFEKDQEGRIIGTHTGDVFVEFPSHAVEAAARVIAPVSHSIADRNFKQMTLFVHLMSQAMVKHPSWVEQTGNKLDGISKQRKQEFFEVSARSCGEARKRFATANSIQPFSPDDVLTPFRNFQEPRTGPASTRPDTGSPVLRSAERATTLVPTTSRN